MEINEDFIEYENGSGNCVVCLHETYFTDSEGNFICPLCFGIELGIYSEEDKQEI